MKPSDLEIAIIQTLAYFDIFEFPLTSWEIWKYLYTRNTPLKASFFDIVQTLDSSDFLEKRMELYDGFYVLRGNNAHVRTRLNRYVIAEKKYARALLVARMLSFLPWIRMIAVCNSMAFSNARDESDIDFFIVAKDGTLWTTRFFSAFLLKLLRLRPTAHNQKNKICLSFYVADSSMNLSAIALPEDPYLYYWIVSLVPIYDPDELMSSFAEENRWVRNMLPNTDTVIPGRRRRVFAPVFRLPMIFSSFETLLKRIQLLILPENLKNGAVPGGIVLSENMLKLHSIERRAYYSNLFREKLAVILE